MPKRGDNMHSLMRAVGFRYISCKRDLEKVLEDVIETGEVHKIISTNKQGENVAEIRKYFSPKMGVVVHGYYNYNNEFVKEYYFPFVVSDGNYPKKVEMSISRHIGKTSFAGTSDDLKMGITTIFYLQNGMDFIDHLMEKKRSGICAPLAFVALSNCGTILLPISKSVMQEHLQKMASCLHNKWLNDAKNGNEAAIENLAVEEYNLYTRAINQIKKEDLLTIVDNSFMPYGVECDHYMIIGDIIKVEQLKNELSGEMIHYLTIKCNEIEIKLAINEEDLTGEPAVGRRFRGSIWLQGIVDFKRC